MTWHLMASGSKNDISIKPLKGNDPEGGVAFVSIRITPPAGVDHATLPILPKGTVYRDRNGVPYTILSLEVSEAGCDDEGSIWIYEYMAVIGAHRLDEIRND